MQGGENGGNKGSRRVFPLSSLVRDSVFLRFDPRVDPACAAFYGRASDRLVLGRARRMGSFGSFADAPRHIRAIRLFAPHSRTGEQEPVFQKGP